MYSMIVSKGMILELTTLNFLLDGGFPCKSHPVLSAFSALSS